VLEIRHTWNICASVAYFGRRGNGITLGYEI
jgi:hypothetical protein